MSNVLNHPSHVTEATRERIETVIAELGFTPSGATTMGSRHWRRSGLATWVFASAASGWYPKKAAQPARPLALAAEPFPGRPLRAATRRGGPRHAGRRSRRS
ncbi:LacI family DNA-binding transcriptional regulator [Actinomadura sp. 1N219]|uniref:LacI family DNA-binding transcriptional regulator n=1 Tax=Actinomadura sp. 1N219 TaxID=3375152 RepID=UPI0037B921D9